MKIKLSVIIPLFLALIFLAVTTLGCKNTAKGAGKDIENMGEKIQDKTN